MKLYVFLFLLVLLGCSTSNKYVAVYEYSNNSLGISSSGEVGRITIKPGNEEKVISNALISVLQEKQVSFVNLEPNLHLTQKKEYITDHWPLNNAIINAHNNYTNISATKLTVGPHYRVYFKVYYVIDELNLSFRIKTYLEIKGLGQAEYKKYKQDYSGKYFFQLLANEIKRKLEQNEE